MVVVHMGDDPLPHSVVSSWWHLGESSIVFFRDGDASFDDESEEERR